MPTANLSITVSFDSDKFIEKHEDILMAVNELYDLVPEWKQGLADSAKEKIINEMISLSIDN